MPFKYVYLMSPNNETTRKGEYGILDEVSCLDHFPELSYFAKRPGRSLLIIDDLSWALSKRGSPLAVRARGSHLRPRQLAP